MNNYLDFDLTTHGFSIKFTLKILREDLLKFSKDGIRRGYYGVMGDVRVLTKDFALTVPMDDKLHQQFGGYFGYINKAYQDFKKSKQTLNQSGKRATKSFKKDSKVAIKDVKKALEIIYNQEHKDK